MKGWRQLPFSTALLVALESAALAQLLLSAIAGGEWVDLATENRAGDQSRVLLAALTVGSAGVSGLTTLGLAGFRPRLSPVLRRISTVCLPLLALWLLPALLQPHSFDKQPLVLLALAAVAGLGLDAALRRALPHAEVLVRILKRPSRLYDGLAALCVVAYSAWAAFASLRLHYKIKTSNFDLALFENLFWNTLHGVHGLALERPYFGEHAELILYPLLPIYWLFPYTETLLIVQALFLGGAAIPLYLIARRWLSATLPAFLIAAGYLAFPAIHGTNFYDFHFLALSPFFVSFAAYFFLTKRDKLLAVSVLFAVLCREDVALGLTLIALGLALLRWRPRASLAVAAFACVWFVLVKMVWMQQFVRDSFAFHYSELLPDGHEGFRGILLTLASNPLFALSTLFSEEKLLLCLQLLVPLCFLPVRQPKTLFFLLPGLVIVGLAASSAPIVNVKFHYSCHFTPYLFIATAAALAVRNPVRRQAASLGLLVASLIVTSHFGALLRDSFKTGFHEVDFGWKEYDADRLQRLRELADQIPDTASVTASELEGAHVARRRSLRALKLGIGKADYVLYGNAGLGSGGADHLEKVLRDESYGVVDSAGEFTLLKRGTSPSKNRRALSKLRKSGYLTEE